MWHREQTFIDLASDLDQSSPQDPEFLGAQSRRGLPKVVWPPTREQGGGAEPSARLRSRPSPRARGRVAGGPPAVGAKEEGRAPAPDTPPSEPSSQRASPRGWADAALQVTSAAGPRVLSLFRSVPIHEAF